MICLGFTFKKKKLIFDVKLLSTMLISGWFHHSLTSFFFGDVMFFSSFLWECWRWCCYFSSVERENKKKGKEKTNISNYWRQSRLFSLSLSLSSPHCLSSLFLRLHRVDPRSFLTFANELMSKQASNVTIHSLYWFIRSFLTIGKGVIIELSRHHHDSNVYVFIYHDENRSVTSFSRLFSLSLCLYFGA